MNRVILILFSVLLLQVAASELTNKKFILIFGNQFAGESVAVKYGRNTWSGELKQPADFPFSKLIVGYMNTKTFKTSIKIAEISRVMEIDLANGRYLFINYDPKMRSIETKQTDSRPPFLRSEPK